MMTATARITETIPVPIIISRRARNTSSGLAPGSLRVDWTAVSFRTRPCSRTVLVSRRRATASEMPSTVRQWVRMVETAPSRISPTASGRSGMTPGLAAGGGPPQPPPQAP